MDADKMATTPVQITSIVPTVAPRLPAAPTQYSQLYGDQLTNILRLYFNGIDTTFTGLLGSPKTGTTFRPGGAYLSFPYAAIERTTDKSFTANTATQITFDTNAFLNSCSNDGTDGISVDLAGIYNYQFSVQLKNTDSSIHSAWIWLRINGVDVANTASKFDVISSHGGTPGFVIGAANFFVQLQAGQTVEMWAAVDNTAVTFDATAAQVSPFAMPAIPSVVATLSFVSRLPS
jgi:hypothetical protein